MLAKTAVLQPLQTVIMLVLASVLYVKWPGRIFKENIKLHGRGIPTMSVIDNPKYSICKPTGVKGPGRIFKENIKLGGRGIPKMSVIKNPKYSMHRLVASLLANSNYQQGMGCIV